MGQYFKPINIEKKEYLLAHDYGDGLKLMEHSYLQNNFVNAVENLLAEGGRWHKCSLVWAGDYADDEVGHNQNLYWLADKKVSVFHPTTSYRYILNHTKKLFVDKDKTEDSEDNWGVHPLPLLTCEGNGRGGGDYRGDKEVGMWARDIISMSNEIPPDFLEFEITYKE